MISDCLNCGELLASAKDDEEPRRFCDAHCEAEFMQAVRRDHIQEGDAPLALGKSDQKWIDGYRANYLDGNEPSVWEDEEADDEEENE